MRARITTSSVQCHCGHVIKFRPNALRTNHKLRNAFWTRLQAAMGVFVIEAGNII